MWFSFWRSRDRFSLDELRYLTNQLLKIQVVNEVNKDFVIEALRSISELVTYGDQHDPSFFDYFMENQVMGEFVRILKISRHVAVSVQLLQTMSIMIQNLKSEHAIYYMFSNEHINFLITYSFDFKNEELLSYYISFLRAISGKLDKNTISLLVKTQNEDVVSFPLYVEAIRFAFHEESMIRIAVRALTLNVYHVGDDSVNKYISSGPRADYFSNLVTFFCKQCISLNGLVADTSKNASVESASTILASIDEIEDNLYYFSDVISAGIPDIGKLITEKILQHLIFPLLLPSLCEESINDIQIGVVSSLYLLCCILRIVKIKDLASTIAAALFCPPEAFVQVPEVKPNGTIRERLLPDDNEIADTYSSASVGVPDSCDTPETHGEDTSLLHDKATHLALREGLLSYITKGDDIQVLGSLSMLATFLQTKELDESVLDALGILPQRKQHKKLLLQALVGEASGEEQLFSSESDSASNEIYNEIDIYLRRLKDQYGVPYSVQENRMSFTTHRFQVLDALVGLFCRSNISSETLWDGGWLLRQLLPYSEVEFNTRHLELLETSYKRCTDALLEEVRGTWPDHLVYVLRDEWTKCKRAMEASSPRKEPKCLLLPTQMSSFEAISADSSCATAEKMLESVKVFVLLHQLQIFSLGRTLPEQPPVNLPSDTLRSSRATTAGLDSSGLKPGTELKLDDAVPCRIAFERGKERRFHFLAVCMGTSGWVVLAEELPLQNQSGVVRVAAPLAGSNPRIDEKHPRWLHLRIRPSTLPFMAPPKLGTYGKAKAKALVDGRWTLAFRDEESCKSAFSMIMEESNLQSREVEAMLGPLFNLETAVHSSQQATPLTNSHTG
uniref:FPL domain-containing protein n=1 Tax=Kalanchoe fedtschenkoi TaxID=63787 RepID=A0A7N0U4F9_KALFE